ncbi:MAG: TIGR00270 family protein [Candidatus Diapherotrites archaeon]|nr:TIGR00270 family protein [Candidatus Diapherotrites archaeon]
MGECELCGREGKVVPAMIDEVKMFVCLNCVKHGKRLYPVESKPTPQRQEHWSYGNKPAMFVPKKRPKPMFEEDVEDIPDLAEDYHKRISKARMGKGWDPEELAKKLFEKKSVITKIESKHMKPDAQLTRKIEKLLDITLREKPKDEE